MAIYNTVEHIDNVSDGVEYFDAFEPDMFDEDNDSPFEDIDWIESFKEDE